MEEVVVILLMGSLAIITGTILILMAMWRRMKFREMHHRERMAMIERGMMPPAESHPTSPSFQPQFHDHRSVTGRRMLSGGIAVIGLGLGLMVLIGVAGEAPEVAFGLGGSIIVVGLAFVVIALVQGERPQQPGSGPPSFMAAPSVPPSSPFTPRPPSPPGPAPRPPDRES